MKNVSLIDQLSELDKERIKNYIHYYGTKNIPTLEIEEWLKYWDHSNQKLFHLLGDTLIKEIPYKIEKDDYIIRQEIKKLKNLPFYDSFNFYLKELVLENIISTDQELAIKTIFEKESLEKNQYLDINIKCPLPNNKYLQIQKGMKISKVVNKICEVCFKILNKKRYDGDIEETLKQEAEEFRLEHSIFLNEKYITGSLCFSIHPLDFLTMSDNASNWSSCMSWASNGCYRVGTIEMMNSNNVICVYLKSDNQDLDFSKKDSKEDPLPAETWNNKKWRQLFYITKDIIVSGKSYPFAFEKQTQIKILNEIVKLAKENLKWEYSFGPELYSDMIHIHSKYRMENNRSWIQNGVANKHNILIDTKGMYNDFLNDVDTKYYCVRNKVKSNKIISVSGKANCICCNSSIIEEEEDIFYYNDRYTATDKVMCQTCLDKLPRCNVCGTQSNNSKYYFFSVRNSSTVEIVCEDCVDEYSYCPICGKPYNMRDAHNAIRLYELYNKNLYLPSELDAFYNNSLTVIKDLYSIYKTRNSKIISYDIEEINEYIDFLHSSSIPAMTASKAICCVKCLKEIGDEKNKNKLWTYERISPCNLHMGLNQVKEILDPLSYNWQNVKMIRDKELIEKLNIKKLKRLNLDEKIILNYCYSDIRELLNV
jgi:hypothetical protein